MGANYNLDLLHSLNFKSNCCDPIIFSEKQGKDRQEIMKHHLDKLYPGFFAFLKSREQLLSRLTTLMENRRNIRLSHSTSRFIIS